ncbi:hypothetical protein MKL29_09275 [Streptococcus suis]|nr:hypothetical protein [Streptococcus suis]
MTTEKKKEHLLLQKVLEYLKQTPQERNYNHYRQFKNTYNDLDADRVKSDLVFYKSLYAKKKMQFNFWVAGMLIALIVGVTNHFYNYIGNVISNIPKFNNTELIQIILWAIILVYVIILLISIFVALRLINTLSQINTKVLILEQLLQSSNLSHYRRSKKKLKGKNG